MLYIFNSYRINISGATRPLPTKKAVSKKSAKKVLKPSSKKSTAKTPSPGKSPKAAPKKVAVKKALAKKATTNTTSAGKTIAKKTSKKSAKKGIVSKTVAAATEILVGAAQAAVTGGIEKIEELAGIKSDANHNKTSKSSSKVSKTKKA